MRTTLAFKVLAGRLPIETHKHWWNRNVESPVALECRSWVDDRRIFTALIWPSLESEDHEAGSDHFERVSQVRLALAKGVAEMAWSTHFEIDWDLKWDHDRKCWVASDGFAYDGLRETDIQSGETPRRGHNGAVPLSTAPAQQNEEGS